METKNSDAPDRVQQKKTNKSKERMFLDPESPLYMCKEKSCQGCNIPPKLSCHFNGRQLALFLSLNVPGMLVSGYLIFRLNPWLLIPWFLFIFSYFGLLF